MAKTKDIIKERRKVCETCKFFDQKTKECVTPGQPRVKHPWIFFSYCEVWEEKGVAKKEG